MPEKRHVWAVLTLEVSRYYGHKLILPTSKKSKNLYGACDICYTNGTYGTEGRGEENRKAFKYICICICIILEEV